MSAAPFIPGNKAPNVTLDQYGESPSEQHHATTNTAAITISATSSNAGDRAPNVTPGQHGESPAKHPAPSTAQRKENIHLLLPSLLVTSKGTQCYLGSV